MKTIENKNINISHSNEKIISINKKERENLEILLCFYTLYVRKKITYC